jgi:hypothetical protein
LTYAPEERTVVTNRSLAALAAAVLHLEERHPRFNFEEHRALIEVTNDVLRVYFQPQRMAEAIEAGAQIRGGGGIVYELDPKTKRVMGWHGVR